MKRFAIAVTVLGTIALFATASADASDSHHNPGYIGQASYGHGWNGFGYNEYGHGYRNGLVGRGHAWGGYGGGLVRRGFGDHGFIGHGRGRAGRSYRRHGQPAYGFDGLHFSTPDLGLQFGH